MAFVELEAPTPYVTSFAYWHVRVKGDLLKLLYTNGKIYENIFHSPNGVGSLFDTECEAHLAGSNYYNMHGLWYPHQVEWSKALGSVQLDIDVKPSTTIQSEEMIF